MEMLRLDLLRPVVEAVYRRRLAGLPETDALWQAAVAGALVWQGMHPYRAIQEAARFAPPVPPAHGAALAWPGRPLGVPRTIWGPFKTEITLV